MRQSDASIASLLLIPLSGNQARPEDLKALEAITGESGAALVVHLKRTFVVAEVDEHPVTFPQGVYDVTDPDEVADIADTLDDTDNPTFAHEAALEYLRQLWEKRRDRR